MSSSAIRTDQAGGGWLRRRRPTSLPRVRLVCLAHAGGSASSFHGWSGSFPADVELVAVQYPGRQDRIAEPCAGGMGPLADSVTEALLPLLDRPIALFGHSMGAAVAYEVALRLEKRYGARPRHLFVSGHASPTRPRREPALHLRDDASLIEGIAELGGMDEAVLADPGLLALVVSSLRADLRLIETYRPVAARAVDVPVTAYVGQADPTVTHEDAAAWAELTSGQFQLRTFPGDHFYLFDRGTDVVSDVAERLAVVR